MNTPGPTLSQNLHADSKGNQEFQYEGLGAELLHFLTMDKTPLVTTAIFIYKPQDRSVR